MALVEKTNNPLNIRYSERNKWVGQTSQLKGFCVFKSMEYGYRASYLLICKYITGGFDTIEKIITRWAPPCENNTVSYIDFVEKQTDIPKNKTINCNSLEDYWTVLIIIAAMARMETGLKPQPQDINKMLGKVM